MLIVFLHIPVAWAGALWLYEGGTPDLGTAGAGRAALAKDASTVGANPAGMTFLDRSQMLAAVQGLYVNTRFDTHLSGFGGGDGGNAGGFVPSGGLHYVHRVTDDFRLGISAGSYFGLGVDYGDSGPQVGLTMGQIPISLPFDLGAGGWDDLVIASPSGEGPFVGAGNGGDTLIPQTIFGALSFTGINATLRMLQRDSRTEIVQAPQLIALDGDPATIFVGETIRYAEAKTEQGQAGGLELSIQEADNSPVEVGFQLMVVPHCIPGTNKLTMDVIPKETSLSGQGDTSIAPPGFDVFTIGASGLEGRIALPRKRSSTIVTSMILESGQPVMIGGLSTDTEIEQHSEVPYLASIPWLGELFQHDSKSHTRRNLMVFITPSIVRTASDQQRLLEKELQRRRSEFGDRLRDILYGEEAAMATGAMMGADPVDMAGETGE